MSLTMDSIGGIYSGTDFIGFSGSIDDVAFAVAVYQLSSYDNEIRANVRNILITNELKKAYREKINEIKQWLAKADGDSDTVRIPADAVRSNYEWSDERNSIVDKGTEKLAAGGEEYYLVDENGKVIKEEVGWYSEKAWLPHMEIDIPMGSKISKSVRGDEEFVRSRAAHHPGATVMVKVKKEVLDTEISRLQGCLDDLNSEGEIQLLQINRALSRRNQALQLASNIMSTSHQSAMAIIQNIK